MLNAWAQFLMAIFNILYSIISYITLLWRNCNLFRYVTSNSYILIINWLKNSSGNGKKVEAQKLESKHIIGIVLFRGLITFVFYIILKKLNTPNIVFSTISITTSFLAASLTLLRTFYYALGYASNDIVLIILWIFRQLKIKYIYLLLLILLFYFLMIYMVSYVGKKEKRFKNI